jgi:hypothetical protein
MRRKTKDEFVAAAKLIHNNKYSYDNFIYVNCDNKSYITCPIPLHGDFLQNADSHIYSKAGCHKCGVAKVSGKKRLPVEDFLKRAKEIHGNKFDYSFINYINTASKIKIICPLNNHGEFWQSPNNHIIQKQGCPKCVPNFKLTLELVIEKANLVHNNKYTYEKLIFTTTKEKGIITCPEHGCFEQSINSHLDGSGCRFCSAGKNEKLVETILKLFNMNYIRQFNIKLPNAKRNNRIDYYLPDYNLFIEYNGEQHYKPVTWESDTETARENFEKQKYRDAAVRKYCFDNNINLFEINGRKYAGKKLIKYLTEQFRELVKEYPDGI